MSVKRKLSFLNATTNETLVLPVTPESFEVSHGINIETVNIHTAGDVVIAGCGTLPTFKIDCMFPASNYTFNNEETNCDDPYSYVWKLEEWCDNRTVLRFIVSEVLNAPVLIEDIVYGERDGTNDVYATLTLRKYRELTAAQNDDTGNSSRSDDASAETPETYTIQSGDTLWAICRKFYGEPTIYQKLADYNGIKNPNLIYAGDTLKIPDKSLL